MALSMKFGSVTSDKVALALTKLKENDIPLVDGGGGNYYCNYEGFEVAGKLVGEELTLTLLKKPWWAPEGKVKAKVREKLKEAGLYELV